MPPIEWNDAWSLDLAPMDDTHKEFVALIDRLGGAADAELPALWQVLIEHTEGHFGQEDRCMLATGFAAGNCHATQHRMVLQTLREAARVVAAGQHDLGLFRQLAKDLMVWFDQHAQAMDAALALHLRRVGYDFATGVVHTPQALPGQAIEGCGGSSCGTPAGQAAEAEATA